MHAWTLAALLPAVTVSKIEVREDGRLLTDAEIKTFVNAARCSCESKIEIGFDVTTADEEGSLVVAHGKRCIDSEQRISDACEVLWRGSLSGLRVVDFEVGVSSIAGCNGTSSTNSLVVLADPTDEDAWTEIAKLELPIDTEPPKPPVNAKVLAGETLAEVVFESPSGTDELEYQVLCELDGAAVFSNPPEAAFSSAQDLCGTGDTIVSEKFVCAESHGGSDSVTVENLENGKTYRFFVVTVDTFGNPSDPAEAGTATPAPDLDLWEVYRNNGGHADGGHCFVATAAYGDYGHPQVVLLRRFRDRTLASSELGREAISFYYRHSPILAAWIAESESRRTLARLLLWPVTFVAAGLTQ
jgi:hypothetical protein